MPRYVDLDKLPLVAIDVDTINGAAFVDLREVQQALLKQIVKESGGRLDAWRRKREFREAARRIRAAHEADERWNAMSEEERKESERACIAAAKIVGEALLRKMREGR